MHNLDEESYDLCIAYLLQSSDLDHGYDVFLN